MEKSESNSMQMIKKFIGSSSFLFLSKGILCFGVIVALGKAFAVHQFWIVVLSVFLLSVPIALGRIYQATISQIRWLQIWDSRGWVYFFKSRRVTSMIFWIVWALSSSFFMLVQFYTYTTLEWATLFLVIPVFYAIFIAFKRFFTRELEEHLIIGASLQWASRVTPFIMLVLYVVIIAHLGQVPRYDSIEGAISVQKAVVADMTGSALAAEVSQWLALYNGAKAFALGNLAAYDAWLALLILATGSLVVFFNVCTMLSCFLIPAPEYLRIFGRLSKDVVPPQMSPSKIAVISAVTTFVVLFIYIPAFTAIEAWIQIDPNVAEMRKKAERMVELVVEQVGSDYVNKGTIAKIQAAKVEALRKVDISLTNVEDAVDKAFDRVEGNVDTFLDWYYSLPAEYVRILKILTGSLEDYLTEKLSEYLQQGDAFRNVETAINEALAKHASAMEEYEQMAKKIISENRINVYSTKYHVVDRMTSEDALSPAVHKDWINFNKRMAAGGIAAGAFTGVIIKKIISKTAGKATLKKAAQVLVKVVAGKAVGSAGGAAGGAAAGAAVGSVIPVIGTTAGAIIGGFVGGLAVGVSVDKMLLMLEESINREAFKRELIESIEEARKDFKQNLRRDVQSLSYLKEFRFSTCDSQFASHAIASEMSRISC